MRSTWARPSLSRDFTVLSTMILCGLVLISVWVSWTTYTSQSALIIENLRKEATRVDKTLDREISHTNYLLRALGQQMLHVDTNDLRKVSQLLKTFHAHNTFYAIWAWTNVKQELVVSSNRGILDEPVNLRDRDYIQKAMADPWQLQIGAPIQGRVSERWVIPIAIGVTDDNGKYLGTLAASVSISELTEEISDIIRRDGVSFGIVSKAGVTLTEFSQTPHFVDTYFPPDRIQQIDISNKPAGVFSKAKVFPTFQGIYAYYQLSEHYPYIILIGYDSQYSQQALESQLLPRVLQIGMLAGFLLLFLWVVKSRIIQPVVQLTEITGKLIQGQPYAHETQVGPVEIDQLAMQIARVSDFVTERKRVEEELREKLEVLLQKERDAAGDKQTFVSE